MERSHLVDFCCRISRNIGIISKLRHYLSLQLLKQMYYNLIYPYISKEDWSSQMIYKKRPLYFLRYFSLGQYIWHPHRENTSKTESINLFFARTYGKETETANPSLNLFRILTVDNVYRLFMFWNLYIRGIKAFCLKYWVSLYMVCNTRYVNEQNLYSTN